MHYQGQKSCIPGFDETLGDHTVHMLRQVEISGMGPGGWVGGDAEDGSITTAVEIMKRFGVHSTWAVTTNHSLFPMQALYSILTARYGSKPMGQWVTMRTELAGVQLIAVVYAGGPRGLTYYLSTCGRTDPHQEPYLSNYSCHEEDGHGAIGKELQRPHIAYLLDEYVPSMEQYNKKQRQAQLELERCWSIKYGWTRLLTTLCGMAVTDFQSHVRYRISQQHKFSSQNHSGTDNTEYEENMKELQIRSFADKISRWINTIEERQRQSPRKRKVQSLLGGADDGLERIRDDDGNKTYAATEKQQSREGRAVGKGKAQNCFVCRMFLKEDGSVLYKSTTWRCKYCHMPLCKVDRTTADPRRLFSCADYHLLSDVSELVCKKAVDGVSYKMPRSIQQAWQPFSSHRAAAANDGERSLSPEQQRSLSPSERQLASSISDHVEV